MPSFLLRTWLTPLALGMLACSQPSDANDAPRHDDEVDPVADTSSEIPDAGDARAPAPREDAASEPTPGTSARCEQGSSKTAWAERCPTAPTSSCVAGTWSDPGSTTGDPLQCESAHFAVHAPAGVITTQQCASATDTLERLVWPVYFGSPMFLPEPYCQSAKKFKASIVIHADYGLTGGGWGQGYMGMWVGPGATADHWGLAHEFMHAVQAQSTGLRCGGNQNYCGWLYESHANWAAHQLPEYRDEVHCSEMLVNAPHLYLGSTRDRYCNWQFMEYLKDRYCHEAVNAIWTTTTSSNDPFTNLAATRGWSTSELNDFFGEWAMHNVTFDYRDPASQGGGDHGAVFRGAYKSVLDQSKPERRLRTQRLDVLDASASRYVVPTLGAPQRFGYNVVRLFPEDGASDVTVTFRGVVQPGGDSDFRWGLVATNAALTSARYSTVQRGTDGTLTFCVTPGESLFLVVTATPSKPQQIQWDQAYPTVRRYPYMVELSRAKPDGYQGGAPNPSASGKRWANGGGWVSSESRVAEGAYVGPSAAVLSGTVGATARIEERAVIAGATINGGTVKGLSILLPGFTLSGNATVDLAWPYGPGFFERPQSASGSARLRGDLELRGANASRTSGTFCGIVEANAAENCAQPDVTPPPPFAWRP